MDITKERFFIPRSEFKLSDEEMKQKANELLKKIEVLQDVVAAMAIHLGKRPKDAVKQGFRFR